MLTYDLDEVITGMMEHHETRLSAEACNTINFCLSSHPCCKDKSEIDRIATVSFAIVGRNIHPIYRERLERLAQQARRSATAAA